VAPWDSTGSLVANGALADAEVAVRSGLPLDEVRATARRLAAAGAAEVDVDLRTGAELYRLPRVDADGYDTSAREDFARELAALPGVRTGEVVDLEGPPGSAFDQRVPAQAGARAEHLVNEPLARAQVVDQSR